MKHFSLPLLFIASVLFFVSCDTVEFKTPVPQSGNELANFPENITGLYLSGETNDTLTITETAFHLTNNKNQKFSIEGGLQDSDFVLKKWNNLYILNATNEKSNYWSVMPLEKQNDTLWVYFLLINNKNFGDDTTNAREYTESRLKQLHQITEVFTYTDKMSGKKKWYIAPADDKLQALFEQQFFIKTLAFKELK